MVFIVSAQNMGNKHELQLLVKKRNYLRGGTQWDDCHHGNIAVKRYIFSKKKKSNTRGGGIAQYFKNIHSCSEI